MKEIWYTYELIDPRNSKPFYIGKGKGNRIHAHEMEASRGVCSRKCNTIRDIQSNNFQVLKNKIALFWDEQAAYDHETDLIEEIGLHNLTNVMPGGQKAWERRKADKKKRNGKPPLSALETIKKFAGQFAYWLKHTECGKHKVTYEVEPAPTDNWGKMQIWMVEYYYNTLALDIFRKAEKENGQQPLIDVFEPYGIDLRFSNGSA